MMLIFRYPYTLQLIGSFVIVKNLKYNDMFIFVLQVLLKRGTTKDGFFLHVPSGSFDHDLFTLIWGPTVAALSFVFDKSSDESIIQKAIAGFRCVKIL